MYKTFQVVKNCSNLLKSSSTLVRKAVPHWFEKLYILGEDRDTTSLANKYLGRIGTHREVVSLANTYLGRIGAPRVT